MSAPRRHRQQNTSPDEGETQTSAMPSPRSMSAAQPTSRAPVLDDGFLLTGIATRPQSAPSDGTRRRGRSPFPFGRHSSFGPNQDFDSLLEDICSDGPDHTGEAAPEQPVLSNSVTGAAAQSPQSAPAHDAVNHHGVVTQAELSGLSFSEIQHHVYRARQPQRDYLDQQLGVEHVPGLARLTDLDRSAFTRTDHFAYQPRPPAAHTTTTRKKNKRQTKKRAKPQSVQSLIAERAAANPSPSPGQASTNTGLPAGNNSVSAALTTSESANGAPGGSQQGSPSSAADTGSAQGPASSGSLTLTRRRMDNGHIMATFAGPRLLQLAAPQASVSTDAGSIVATGSRKRSASSVALPRQGVASSTGAARPTKIPRRHQATQRPAGNMNTDNQSQSVSGGLPANLPSAGANSSASMRQRQASAPPAQPLRVTRRSRLFDLLSAGREEEDEPGSIVPDSARRGARRRPRARPLPPLDPLPDTPRAVLQTEDTTAPAQTIAAHPLTMLPAAPLLPSAPTPLRRPTPSVPTTTTTTTAATAPLSRRVTRSSTRNSREEPSYEAVENTFLRSLNERCVGLAPRDVPTDKSLVEEFNNRFAGTQLTVRGERGEHRLTEPRPTRTKAAITSHVRREGFWADIKRVRAEGRGWKPGPKLGSKKRSKGEMESEEEKEKEKEKEKKKKKGE